MRHPQSSFKMFVKVKLEKRLRGCDRDATIPAALGLMRWVEPGCVCVRGKELSGWIVNFHLSLSWGAGKAAGRILGNKAVTDESNVTPSSHDHMSASTNCEKNEQLSVNNLQVFNDTHSISSSMTLKTWVNVVVTQSLYRKQCESSKTAKYILKQKALALDFCYFAIYFATCNIYHNTNSVYWQRFRLYVVISKRCITIVND